MFPLRFFPIVVLFPFAFTLLAAPESSLAQGTLIPITTRRDMVFDFSGQRLYISTSDGFVRRYNISTGQLETPFNVGGSLNGIDIARDNSFLLVAQNTVGVSQGTIHKVDSSTGAVTNINYTRASGEGGAWDVAVGSSGLALVTTNYQGSGWTPVHQIALATNAISERSDVPGSSGTQVRGSTDIHRSADSTRFYFLEGSISSGPIFTYNATTDAFGSSARTDTFLSAGAANRNGTLLGTLLSNNGASLDTAPNFNYMHSFGAANNGVAFDAQTDTFYAVNTSTNQIIAYDTNTYAEEFRLNIGESMDTFFQRFGGGTLVASPDGVHLALETPSGIRIFDVTMGTVAPPPAFGTPRDMVFDHAGQRLYISTAEGLVWPYILSSSTFETPFDFGGSLNALDITADDSFLLVAQRDSGLTQGAFQKLNLTTGEITNATYTQASGEEGALDVAITSNGLALGTTIFSGSGWIPLHQIDLATNAVTNRTDAPGSGPGGTVRSPTQIHRSADRTRLYLLEGNISSGPLFTYSAVSNTFGARFNTNTSLSNASAAVNRNGMLLGTRLSNSTSLDTAPSFNFLHTFNTLDSGIAFDALQDTIYGINSSKDQIIAYDTTTFVEKFRFDIGENVNSSATLFGPGTLVASQDGHYLAMMTPTAVRIFSVPAVPLTTVSSRKTHGSAGLFDIDMPLDGNPGVECRAGGANGQFSMVFTFGVSLTSVASAAVTSGVGTVNSSLINPSNSREYIVNLTNVADVQYIKARLTNVNDVAGDHTGAISAQMGILAGDTDGNRSTNSSDITQTKGQSGLAVTNGNFREDVMASGTINASDVSLVKSKSGRALPANLAPHSRQGATARRAE